MAAVIPIAFARPRKTSPAVQPVAEAPQESLIATNRIARDSGLAQQQFLATTLDVQRIQMPDIARRQRLYLCDDRRLQIARYLLEIDDRVAVRNI